MPHTQDCQHAALVGLYGEGQLNDLMFQWAGGQAGESLNDALYRYLGESGGTGDQLNDRWYSALTNAGYDQASLPDKLQAFWCEGGGTFGLMPIAGWTGLVNCLPVGGILFDNPKTATGYRFDDPQYEMTLSVVDLAELALFLESEGWDVGTSAGTLDVEGQQFLIDFLMACDFQSITPGSLRHDLCEGMQAQGFCAGGCM
jgi:hypothetical protein